MLENHPLNSEIVMKAYWIAHVDVTDPQQYTEYTQRAPAAFKFTDDLKKNKSLLSHRWQMPQPKLLANGTAQFLIEGVPSHAPSH